MQELTLKIRGMSCAMCVKSIESAVGTLDGVEEIRVNLATESAFLKFDPKKVSLDEIVRLIEDLGYKAEMPEPEADEEEHIAGMKRKLYFAALSGSFLFLSNYLGFAVPLFVQLVVALAAMLYSGREMFLTALRSLRKNTQHGRDVLDGCWLGVFCKCFCNSRSSS